MATTDKPFACVECGTTYRTFAQAAKDDCIRRQIAGIVNRDEDPELFALAVG